MPPKLSIVIPCRNEISRLPDTLTKIENYRKVNPEIEVVIVVEKGTDGTDVFAKQWADTHDLAQAICNNIAKGKGFAVKTGMLAANGQIRMFMDADGAVPIGLLDTFIETIYNHTQDTIVIGSRQHTQSRILIAQPNSRVFSGRMFNLVMRMQGFTVLKDTQCGFKMLSGKLADKIFAKTNDVGFGFDVEMLYIARKEGAKTLELPVDWTDKPGSKVTAISGGVKALLLTSYICWKHRLRYLLYSQSN